MSHSVTIRTTTTTTNAGFMNYGLLKTWPGLLKLFEVVVGGVVLGLVAYYGTHINDHYIEGFGGTAEHTYLFLVAFGCLLATFLLLVASVVSLMTSSLLSKTLFELLYHFIAFLLYLTAGLAFLIFLLRKKDHYKKGKGHDGKIAAAVLGLFNSLQYLMSFVFSYKAYKSST